MKNIILLLAVAWSVMAGAQNSWITTNSFYQRGAADPTSVATNAPTGTYYFKLDGNIYIKKDEGKTTNWALITNSGGSSGANTALSNLASVAINSALLPGATGTIDLGSQSRLFKNAYLTSINDAGNVVSVDPIDRILYDETGATQITWTSLGVQITDAPDAGGILFNGAQSEIASDGAKISWDDVNGREGIGTSVPALQLHVVTSGTTSTDHAILQENNAVSANGSIFAGRHSRGSFATPTAILSADNLVNFQGFGYDGTSYGTQPSGFFRVQAAENFSSGHHGTNVQVNVTPVGTATNNAAALFGSDSSFTQYCSGAAKSIAFSVGSTTTSYALRWPLAQGLATTYLQDDGSGNLSWAGSPSGTICGWYDVGTTTLVVSCEGSDPSVSCPTGYTQKASTTVKFCAAN